MELAISNLCTEWDIKGFLDFNVVGYTPASKLEPYCISFFKKWDGGICPEKCLLVVPAVADITAEVLSKNAVFYSNNPRLDFAKIAQSVERLGSKTKERRYSQIDGYTRGENVKMGTDCKIFSGAFIDHDVILGKSVSVMHNATIHSGVEVGDNSVIGTNSSIGHKGFGFERDGDGKSYRLPHIGGVKIGDNVDIGALNTIASGTLTSTIICDNVKTDDHVHIAHNCIINSGSYIIAGAVISGSVEIGKNNWIAPNSTIINKATTGDNVTVGLGAVVTQKKISDRLTVTGNPARSLDKIVKERRINSRIRKLLKKTSNEKI